MSGQLGAARGARPGDEAGVSRRPRRTEPARDGAVLGVAGGVGRSPWSCAVSVALIWLLLATAMIPWWPVYESGEFLIAAAVAIVAGTGIGLVGAWRGWPSWAVLVALAIAYLLLGVPAAVPSRAIAGVLPTPAGMLDLIAATALSWKQLVTIAVPVGSYQALLVPPFLLGLLASTIAVTIAFRTRHPVAATLPPAFLMTAGILLGVVHGGLALPAGLAFLLAVVAWLANVAILDRQAIGSRSSVERALTDARRVFGASAIVAVALLGATAAAVVLPTPVRTVVRSEVQPPFRPHEYESPLAAFRAAFEPARSDDVMLEVDGLPPGTGLAVATLDTYDGIVYSVGGSDGNSVSGSFTRLPYRLDQTGVEGDSVQISVAVDAYEDIWVPGVGQLERIDFGGPRAETLADGFVYNDTTGTGAVVSGLSRGDSYVAWSVAMLDPTGIASMQPGTSVVPAAPDLPDELTALLNTWAPVSGAPGERLAAVVDGFRSTGFVSHGMLQDEAPSRSGHALDRLEQLATDQPMVGDGEQYAVAAALMARKIGFPARVVVGYLATDAAGGGSDGAATASGGSAATTSTTVFHRDDLQAWIEVQRDDGAWIALDPNPSPRPVPEPAPEQPEEVSRPESALPPPPERTQVDEQDAPADHSDERPQDDLGRWLGVLTTVATVAGVSVLVLALIASPFLAVIVAKIRRRRVRRTTGSPVERIEGGWLEFADTAADYGYPIRSNSTRAEQAATVGGLSALVLASVVDRAVFAPGEPEAGDEERVWRSVDELQQRLAAPRTRRERWRAAISLTSLGGYAVSRRGGRR
ncbi:Transglutaminase-like superfamily protein [Agromyces sp. CF514]|uniref:transglutaminase family protein n=1 Tax=Agromyces sp. CF514 TaxID=1881031 RepID=UPI0008E2768E|nr:transglutaminase domain-containing protein [Agromyces sp. CF514]SFR87387.1 Transglutaminase-like superfamily protein [Agromyces sp. CF514]